jgi:hypothetical protein
MELISIQTDLLFRYYPLCNSLLKVGLGGRDYYLSKRRLKISAYFDRYTNSRTQISIEGGIACPRCFELFVKFLTKDRFTITYSEVLILLHICIRLNVCLEVKEFLKNIILINLKTSSPCSSSCGHFNMTEVLLYLGIEATPRGTPFKNQTRYKKMNPESFLFYQNIFGPHLNKLIRNDFCVSKKTSDLDKTVVEQTRLHFAKNKGFYKYVDLFFSNMKNVENNNKLTKIDENYKLVELCPMIKITSGRFLVDEMNKKFRNESMLATLIQKHVRQLLAKKKFFQMNKAVVEKKVQHRVVKLQTVVRTFLILKSIKKFYLFKKIIRDREHAAHKITAALKTYFVRKKIALVYLLDHILCTRHTALLKLQNHIRSYIFGKKFKDIFYKEKNYYSLTYPFKAKSVLLKVFISDGNDMIERVYRFTYCTIRHMWVLYINPADLPPGKYRVLLIVDDIITCDGRYPHIEFSDGHYYNIIDFNLNSKDMHIQPLLPLQLTDHTDDTKNNTSLEHIEQIKSKATSNDSDASFLLNRGDRLGSFDKNLVKNLADKEHCSYLEIIKDSIREDFHDDYNY